ncbi:hypothetical protein ACIQGT_25675 [Streptomyces sp. NPDC093108]|uniref:hypothetical protein n=1 Tax=Streptomyces sp. NPDC093108 TaxID=3366030 RepID=UPI0037F2E985
MKLRRSGPMATFGIALALLASQPAHAQALSRAPEPVGTVFGGPITDDSPLLPIGAKVPDWMAQRTPAAALAPPAPPALTRQREQAARVMPDQDRLHNRKSTAAGPLADTSDHGAWEPRRICAVRHVSLTG